MNNFLKKFLIFLLIIILIIAFSTSYANFSIDNIQSVVALGIDTSDTNQLRLSFQFTNASSVSESGTTEQSPSIIYTIDASSISSGINLMNSYVGKEINFSHCKLIVFSEELAMKGISDEVYTLTNDAQVRPSTNIVISKCSAKYYIENSKPLFENLITQYYEVFSNSSQYTGYTSDATIGDFFNSMICNSCEPFTILGGISSESTNNPTTINAQKDSSGKSNESPISGETTSENLGLAVFKSDRLVGELNSIETLSFLATRNAVDGFLISVPDPENSNAHVDVYITPVGEASSDVKLVNGSPYIKIKYHFSGRIYSMKKDATYLDSTTLSKISASCNSYLQSTFSNYLYRTAKELKSDINGFGKSAKANFLTIQDFENYNWNEKYKDAFFDVSVDASIKSGFLLNES